MPQAAFQFLTAVFELRPSRRKAAALERVRSAAEDFYWERLEAHRALADGLATETDRRRRLEALHRIASGTARAASLSGLPESVGAGVAREVEQTISSYVGLTLNGLRPGWPRREHAQRRDDHRGVLAELARATTAPQEEAARRAFRLMADGDRWRPLVMVRARDCQIVRDKAGRLAAVLNVLHAKDQRSRKAVVHEGFDAATGDPVRRSRRKTVLVMPLACSRWHENKFLNGKAKLKSSIVVRRHDRWFLLGQFALPVATVEPSGASLGVDRGCVFPAATAVVCSAGAIIHLPPAQGDDIGARIARASDRRRKQLRRRGWSSPRHARAIEHDLHQLANGVVERARVHGAEVAVEKLGETNRTNSAKDAHAPGGRDWPRVLDTGQFGKLQKILSYKLALAGLPPLRGVVAGRSSDICPACGARDAKSHVERILFRCTSCGHEENADANGAILIARRGVLIRKIQKGDKLDVLHQDMVARLRSRDDGGLGPLATGQRVVAAHAAAATAAEPDEASTSTERAVAAGQKAIHTAENVREDVVAERGGRTSLTDPNRDPKGASGVPRPRRRGELQHPIDPRRKRITPRSSGRFGEFESAG